MAGDFIKCLMLDKHLDRNYPQIVWFGLGLALSMFVQEVLAATIEIPGLAGFSFVCRQRQQELGSNFLLQCFD
jgi:hypothetical protein